MKPKERPQKLKGSVYDMGKSTSPDTPFPWGKEVMPELFKSPRNKKVLGLQDGLSSIPNEEGGQGEVDLIKANKELLQQNARLLKDLGKLKKEHARHKKLSLVASKTGNSVIITNKKGQIEWVNNSFSQLTGYSAEEIMGKKHHYFSKIKEIAGSSFLKLKDVGSHPPLSGEILGIRKDGACYWASLNISTVLDDKKEISHFIIIESDITRIKKAEEKRRRSDQLYRTLTRNFPRGIIEVFDRNGTLNFVEGKELEAMGLTPGMVVGKSLFDLHDQATARKIRGYHEMAFGGSSITFEFEEKGKFYSASTLPLIDEMGEINSIMSVVENITERKQADLQLKESYKSLSDFRNALDLASLVSILDKVGRFTYVNHNFCIKSGYTSGELLGQHYSILFSDNQHDKKFFDKLAQKARQGKACKGDTCNRVKDGPKFWLDTSLIPFLGNENEPLQYLCISYDISDRKSAEEKIQENERRLQEAQRIAKMGSWQYQVDNQKLNWPEETYHIFDLEPGEEGPTLENMVAQIHPEDAEILKSAMKKAIGESIPYSIDFRITLGNGAIRHINAIGRPILNSKGRVEKINGTVTDITDRKETESILTEQNKELKKINSELDRFVYSASHDLRAPLVSVLGLINIIKLEDEKSNIDGYLAMMAKSIYKLDKFIQDITDYSRNARTELKNEKIDFQEILSETIEGLKYIDGADRIEKSIRINQERPFFADKQRLSIIFSNLISNAIRYSQSERRNPFLSIDVFVTREEAEIRVKDNGQGIAPEHHEKIFEMFYRATDNKSGSGLGLYIVKETLHRLNGTISVDSQQGIGCCFTLNIPNKGV